MNDIPEMDSIRKLRPELAGPLSSFVTSQRARSNQHYSNSAACESFRLKTGRGAALANNGNKSRGHH